MFEPEVVAHLFSILFGLALVELVRCDEGHWKRRGTLWLALFVLAVSWYASCGAFLDAQAHTIHEAKGIQVAFGNSAVASLAFGAVAHFAACLWFYFVKRKRMRAAISLTTALILLFLLEWFGGYWGG